MQLKDARQLVADLINEGNAEEGMKKVAEVCPSEWLAGLTLLVSMCGQLCFSLIKNPTFRGMKPSDSTR